MAGRVQEAAGLQKQSVDFNSNFLVIKDVAIWSKETKRFDYLKHMPKNGETRVVYIGNELAQRLKARIQADLYKTNFVFHIDGEPVAYRQVQYNYEWALKKVGLRDRFSGTHILRYSIATLTRLVTGSLDSVQGVTGHKDHKLVQHYAHLGHDVNKNAIVAVENCLVENNFFR